MGAEIRAHYKTEDKRESLLREVKNNGDIQTISAVLVAPGYLSGLTDDLSIGGLYLRTNLLLHHNEVLKVSIPLPGQEKVISCKANVAWTNFAVNQRKPETPNGVGLQFEDLLLEDLIALLTFVDHHNDETTMPMPPV